MNQPLAYLDQLKEMTARQEQMAESLSKLPAYDVPEPPSNPEDYETPPSVSNEKFVHAEDDAARPKSEPSPIEKTTEKLNEISAQEVVSIYSGFVNMLAVEGYEYKNADFEENLKAERTMLRRTLDENPSFTAELRNEILFKIEDVSRKLEKLDDRRKYLQKVSQINEDKQIQAADLLAKIWKVKGIEVNPLWGLFFIAVFPVINSLFVIFLDGKKLKLN